MHYRDPDYDEARADDFRCLGCEAPLPLWKRRGGFCEACRVDHGDDE